MLDERMYNIIGHLCCVRGTIPLTTSAAEEAIERLFPENAHEWVLSAARKATLFSKGNRLSGSPLLIDVKKVIHSYWRFCFTSVTVYYFSHKLGPSLLITL